MTCKDCIHSGVCYKENDYDNFPDRCGSFIPERQQGEWQITKVGYAKCSICKCEREVPENYCGYCGAKMKGCEEEKVNSGRAMTVFIYSEDDMYAGGGYTECDYCKQRFSNEGYPMIHDAKYCPDCGAKVLIKR